MSKLLIGGFRESLSFKCPNFSCLIQPLKGGGMIQTNNLFTFSELYSKVMEWFWSERRLQIYWPPMQLVSFVLWLRLRLVVVRDWRLVLILDPIVLHQLPSSLFYIPPPPTYSPSSSKLHCSQNSLHLDWLQFLFVTLLTPKLFYLLDSWIKFVYWILFSFSAATSNYISINRVK